MESVWGILKNKCKKEVLPKDSTTTSSGGGHVNFFDKYHLMSMSNVTDFDLEAGASKEFRLQLTTDQVRYRSSMVIAPIVSTTGLLPAERTKVICNQIATAEASDGTISVTFRVTNIGTGDTSGNVDLLITYQTEMD